MSETLAAIDPSATLADEDSGETALHPAELAAGATLGRYVVTRRLGAGGMGVVYAAFDPELDREVAIKLLRSDPIELGSKASVRSKGELRLLLEAKAMAKLHHPNVIVVHDVGTMGDHVFIAMEYLDGGTLHDYLRAEARHWQDVLEKFRRAGEGLAAAHAAEIVHRDFKPQNVLLSSGGRVCVMDFGLAQTEASQTLAEHTPSDESTDPTDGLSRLTHTGAIIGTPAYMAPEQHSHGIVDARSDQFSFCVALYEALYGQRPFEGDTFATLVYHVLQGDIRPPPVDRRVPRWLYPRIIRGLRVDPDDRYPSMRELLAALDADPAKRRRTWAVGLGVTALAAAGGTAWIQGQGDEPCTGGRDRFEEVWNEEVRERVGAAFVATGVPDAEHTWTSIEPELDAYARAWVTMHREACEATRVRGEQSEDLLDRRMVCLEKRRRELFELVALFADADAELVRRARSIAGKQSRLEPCADAEALLGGVAPPDPEQRDRVLTAEATLKRVMMFRDAGRIESAQATLDAVAEDIDAIGHAPTRVALLYLQSAVAGDEGRLEDAERFAYDSALLAAECGDDDAAALAWTGVIRIVGIQRRKFEELPPILRSAEAAVARVDDDFRRGGYLATIGTVDLVRERYAEAEEPLREAHRLLVKALGPEDPRTLDAYEMLAISLQQQRRLDEAEPMFREILAAYERREAQHPSLGQTLGNLASLAEMRGDDEEARALHRRALEALTTTYGPEHPAVATVHYHLGKLARRHGALDEAERHIAREREILTKTHGPTSELVAFSHHGQGQLELARQRPDAARASFLEALAIWETSLGSEHARLADPLTGIGKAELMADRAEAAVPPLERALRLRRADPSSGESAGIKLQLARALWDAGGDRRRALRLADEARTEWAAADEAAGLAEVDAWLDEHDLDR